MASKENIYKIGRSIGSIAAAGAALYGGIQYMENRGQAHTSNHPTILTGQTLTEDEIAQIRNYDKWIAQSSEIKSTPTSTPPTAVPEKDFKIQSVEISQIQPVEEITPDQSALIKKYRSELPGIINKITPNPQEIEDLQIYYPIYRAAQDRFGTPWYLTWIVHEAESTASRNPNAFKENCLQCGAMQRNIRYHPQEDVDRANIGLEYLQKIPTRSKKWDTTDIVWAASALRQWQDTTGSVLGSLGKYSAADSAQIRYQKFILIKSGLGN